MIKHHLEQYRIFPFIAWGLVIIFAYFVYTLVVTLGEHKSAMQEQTTLLEERARTAPQDITDFSQ